MIIYFGAGFSGNLLSTIIYPNSPSVGASGSIFGLIGSLLGYLAINWSELNYQRRG